ncbi:MAG: NADH-quinone oxidoreductase subunit NuoE [Tepidisphaeraceae bacterium]|jgi:NADH-quinone oxidoreductase subunit E
MAWIVENRRTAVVEKPATPYLTDAIKHELSTKFIPRYPTKQAVLLPALHAVQHAHGWIPQAALVEIAEFLQLSPAEVLDTATFYEEYWLKPKGQYLVQVCRSLACEICGSRKITEHLKARFGVEEGETSADGRFTLIELECLGSCGTAPAVLVNDVLYEDVTCESIDKLIGQLPSDPHHFKDPTVTWETPGGH